MVLNSSSLLYQTLLTQPDSPLTGVAQVTVSQLELAYTKRERGRAKTAREMNVNMGYPSDAALAELIGSGVYSTLQ